MYKVDKIQYKDYIIRITEANGYETAKEFVIKMIKKRLEE